MNCESRKAPNKLEKVAGHVPWGGIFSGGCKRICTLTAAAGYGARKTMMLKVAPWRHDTCNIDQKLIVLINLASSCYQERPSCAAYMKTRSKAAVVMD